MPVKTVQELIALLGELVAAGKSVCVRVEANGVIGLLTVEAPDDAHAPVVLPDGALFFSPTEEAVVKVASPVEWKTAPQLSEQSEQVGLINARDFSSILRNLVERGVLRSSGGKGYRLNENQKQN